MEGYETEVITELSLSSIHPEIKYDFTRWKITDRKIEWIGSKNEQDIETHLQKLSQDVFENCQIMISGRLQWQGEDHEDFGTILVDENKVITQFGKIYKWIKDLKIF